MGLFFIYNEITEHKNDVITHSEQTKGLEDVFLKHINATKKGVGLIEKEIVLLQQINRSTYNNTATTIAAAIHEQAQACLVHHAVNQSTSPIPDKSSYCTLVDE
jgi:hypothetical protein